MKDFCQLMFLEPKFDLYYITLLHPYFIIVWLHNKLSPQGGHVGKEVQLASISYKRKCHKNTILFVGHVNSESEAQRIASKQRCEMSAKNDKCNQAARLCASALG